MSLSLGLGFGLALALLAAAPAAAQQGQPAPPALAGKGVDHPSERVDGERLPWRALGKLQATAAGLRISCTGALIGPATVLTAAHCLFNIRTRRFFPASSLHFLVGYDRGNYAGVAGIVAFTVGPGFDPENEPRTRGSDWALVTLDKALGTPDRVLALRERPIPAGTPVMVGGYSRDHELYLTADTHCRILAQSVDSGGRPLLWHDCVAKQGTSGAPLLALDGITWTIVGVEVASGRQFTRGVAVIPREAQARR